VHCCVNSCLDMIAKMKRIGARLSPCLTPDAGGRSEFCFGVVNLEFDLDVCVHVLELIVAGSIRVRAIGGGKSV